MDIYDLRRSYKLKTLSSKDLTDKPIELFRIWFNEARQAEIDEVNACALATADEKGKPSCRFILLKKIEEESLLFFTNYESRKAKEMEKNPQAALTIWWKELERQVRFEGGVSKCSDELSAEYFSKRPRRSQLAAWASDQSSPLESRARLEEEYSAFEARFEGKDVPIPPHWGGYRLNPTSIEFWQGRDDRLHDRFLYLKDGENWSVKRLAP